MAVEVIMPKVDMDMVRGRLAVWHAAEGDAVTKGQPLFDIETDKAAMEVEAPASGRLARVSAKAGDDVDVGTALAWIVADGEAAIGLEPAQAPRLNPAPPSAAPALPQTAPPSLPPGASAILATPVARRLARENRIDLAALSGSGPRGRIQKSDVEAAVRRAAGTPATPPPPAATATPPAAAQDTPLSDAALKPYADRPHTAHPLDGMRRTIAARLTEAKQTIPHFYLRRDVCLDTLLDLRTRLNADLAPRGTKVSVNDFIILACARALQDVPAANAIWAGDQILRMVHSDIAVAVSVDGGLFTPVIRDAETKSLTGLSAEMKSLAARARDRKLAPADYQGGSFAISNLGMFGIDGFDAIINPPQSAILAVGAASLRPAINPDRSVTAATIMSLTLSVDHRVIDGALGAALFQSIKTHLESPLALIA